MDQYSYVDQPRSSSTVVRLQEQMNPQLPQAPSFEMPESHIESRVHPFGQSEISNVKAKQRSTELSTAHYMPLTQFELRAIQQKAYDRANSKLRKLTKANCSPLTFNQNMENDFGPCDVRKEI